MEFKDRIKQLRIEKNMTAAELAVKTGKGESAIRMWEAGKSTPDRNTLIKLSKMFDYTTDYFLGLTDLKKYNIDDKDLIIKNLEMRIEELKTEKETMINSIQNAIIAIK